jgi:hypothetical protein
MTAFSHIYQFMFLLVEEEREVRTVVQVYVLNE